jgi:hypothetical protein
MKRLVLMLAAALVLIAAAPAHAQFVSDAFTETGGLPVILSSHTPDTGSTWVKHGSYTGDLTVDHANDRVVGGGAALGIYYNDAAPASADYTVQVDVVMLNNTLAGYPGVAGRVNTGADTMYRAIYDQPNGNWVLDKQVAGANTVLGTYAQSLSNSTTYVLKLEMIGTAIKLYVDGVERVCANSCAGDSSIAAAGKAGAILVSSGVSDLDNFVATNASAAAATCTLGLLGVGC